MDTLKKQRTDLILEAAGESLAEGLRYKNTREIYEGQLLGMRTALYYLGENEVVSVIDGMIEELRARTDWENDN